MSIKKERNNKMSMIMVDRQWIKDLGVTTAVKYALIRELMGNNTKIRKTNREIADHLCISAPLFFKAKEKLLFHGYLKTKGAGDKQIWWDLKKKKESKNETM